MNLRNFRNEARDDYLEAILMITQEKGHCRSINIAETLDVTKPSVSVAVGKLIEAGLITMDGDKTGRPRKPTCALWSTGSVKTASRSLQSAILWSDTVQNSEFSLHAVRIAALLQI